MWQPWLLLLAVVLCQAVCFELPWKMACYTYLEGVPLQYYCIEGNKRSISLLNWFLGKVTKWTGMENANPSWKYGGGGRFSPIVKTRMLNQSLSKLNKTTFHPHTGVCGGFYLCFKLHHPIFMRPKFWNLFFLLSFKACCVRCNLSFQSRSNRSKS